MAKKKADKIKIPKEIAGVKIPKTLRKSGKAALQLSQNPIAREMLSAGLMAAATAVAANSRARKAAVDSGREAADAFTDAASTAATSATNVGAVLAGVAAEAAQKFFAKGNRTKSVSPEVEPGVTVAEPGPATSANDKPSAKPRVTTAKPEPVIVPNGTAAVSADT